MLAHWLKPSDLAGDPRQAGHHISRKIIPFFPEMAEIPDGAVVLVGAHEKAADAVRAELYRMGWHFGKLPVVDLGNLRKTDSSFTIQVLKELVDGRKTVILIGQDTDLAYAQMQAYGENIKGVNACLIRDQVEYDLEPSGKALPLLNRMLKPGEHHVLHLSLIGTQRHEADPAAIRHLMETEHAEIHGLGLIRQDMETMEPVIRDADMVNINLSALEFGCCPASGHPGPNGLNGLEICTLARYAGLSEKLSSLSIGDWTPGRDRRRVTARMIAQTIWYFLEGVSQRQGDFPVSMDGLTAYHVHHDHFPDQLVFWKSGRTGRWWLQVPVREDAGHERHRLVPCTYSDYEEACRNELPDRVMQAQWRFR